MARKPDCHPDRKHCAFGLCKKCYTQLPEVKERARERQREYYATDKGREIITKSTNKFKTSDKGKEYYREYHREYRNSDKGKMVQRKYTRTDKGRKSRRATAKRYANTKSGREKIRKRNWYRHHLRRCSYSLSGCREEVEKFYDECPKGYTVDHIIPMTHDKVCGLHVPWNLQYLTRSDNSSKNNQFDGTYENDSWTRIRIHCIETGDIFKTVEEVVKEMNLHQSSVSSVLSGRYKQTKGYSFEYIEVKNDR